MGSIISDGAKKRLFKMAIKANKRLEECTGESEDDYKVAKARSNQWNEIVTVLGLANELRQYCTDMKGIDK